MLTASELGVVDPDNPGPAAVRRTGRLCYASANRAVTALGHLDALRPVPHASMNVVTDRSRRAGRRRLVALLAVAAIVPPTPPDLGGHVVGQHRRAGRAGGGGRR